MSRWKAAGIHLLISIAVGLIVGMLLLFVWYPPPFFHAAGADVLILLLVGVDMALGPLLTLVVFKSGKRGLKFDLTLIAIAQTAALIYGLSVVLRSRPVFLVSAVDRFVLVSANDIDPKDLEQGSEPQFRSLSWTGARTVGAMLPRGAEGSALLFSAVAGKDVEKYPKYYVSFEKVAPDLLKRAKPLDQLKLASPEDSDRLRDGIASVRLPKERIVWIPLVARKTTLTMLMDGSTGKPLKAVAINPWK